VFIDLKPLTKNRQFRLLFIGQTVSLLGSMMTYVAVPYQVYQITKSSMWVGVVSSVQLIPLLIAGLYGGALADTVDRRRLLLASEWGLFATSLVLMGNSLLLEPSLWVLMFATFMSSALTGLHRPAMDALTPQVVTREELTAVASLGSLRYAVGAVVGPALGGILIATWGTVPTYAIDAASFLISIWCLKAMTSIPIPEAQEKVSWQSIVEGVQYATSNPIIMGTYLVDILAMLFAMPLALFPQLAEEFQQKDRLGWLYASIPVGAGLISLFSKSLDRVRRQGAGVIIAATFWGVAVLIMAYAPNLEWMAFCLMIAGVFDGISAIYRQTIWNEVIPTNVRGRLASLNMLSYMIGPLLGNARAGTLAAATSTHFSILSGGVLCAATCGACVWIFPKFWRYERRPI
jgi:MFS family permease